EQRTERGPVSGADGLPHGGDDIGDGHGSTMPGGYDRVSPRRCRTWRTPAVRARSWRWTSWARRSEEADAQDDRVPEPDNRAGSPVPARSLRPMRQAASAVRPDRWTGPVRRSASAAARTPASARTAPRRPP